MKVAKRFALALAVVFAAAGIAAAAETVKIGVYLPITGGNAVGGQLELDGVNLAHKQYPEVDGKKIELVVVDNKSDKVEAANAVKRLIEREKVCAIIGTYGSSLAMAGGEVAEKAGVPMVGTSCTNPLVTQGKKYVFRVCFIDPFQGAGAANFAFTELKAKTAAMLIEVTEDYSVGLGNFFKQNFVKLGGEVVSVMNYQKGDQDFTAQLTEIISKNPDVLYIPANFAEGAIIMRQARELGATFSILGGDAMDNPEMVSIGGDSVEGFSYTSFASLITTPQYCSQSFHAFEVRMLDASLPCICQQLLRIVVDQLSTDEHVHSVCQNAIYLRSHLRLLSLFDFRHFCNALHSHTSAVDLFITSSRHTPLSCPSPSLCLQPGSSDGSTRASDPLRTISPE